MSDSTTNKTNNKNESKSKKWRLAKIAREFNVKIDRVVEVLKKEGYKGYKGKPNEKVDEEVVMKLARHFGMDKKFKSMLEERRHHEEKEEERKESISLTDIKNETEEEPEEKEVIYIQDAATGVEIPVEKDSVELDKSKKDKEEKQEEPKKEEEKAGEQEDKVGPKVVGKIDLDSIDTSTRPKPKSKKKTTKSKKDKTQIKIQTSEEKAEQESVSAEAILDRIAEIDSMIEEITKEDKKADNKKDEKESKPKDKTDDKKSTDKEEKQPSTEKTTGEPQAEQAEEPQLRIVGHIDLDSVEQQNRRPRRKRSEKPSGQENSQTQENQSGQSSRSNDRRRRRSSRRIERVDIESEARRIRTRQTRRRSQREVILDQQEVDRNYRETLQQAAGKTGKSIAKKRQEKKKQKELRKQEIEQQLSEKKVLTITEFLTVGQLASLIGVDKIELLQKALSLGIKATVNYPLGADDIELLAAEYGYDVDFVDVTTLEELEAQFEDNEKDLVPRPPIVTVMGHVDHGKTSLLDYIRNTNIVAGEAGGITQHIGAYHITLDDGRNITFIDTPGHEAFTAMRARGAKITDIAVIVIAADDGVRPQTEEALDHAKAAGVPIIFALNKVDKETADPEKIRNQLAQRGYLVSSWGGDYFDVEISAKTGYNIDELLETILLVAEDLDLKANPKRPAVGTVLEASVEKGRGPVANVIVRTGTLKIGDIILAGSHYGRVRAMYNERGQRIKSAGPSIPAQILGLDGAPDPGEPFVVMANEKEAKQKANQREQIKRVIQRRSHKALTLEEISRRLQVGEFSEINVIIRADVQGTADALAEQLEKLSTEQVEVNVIRKATGQITESDVMLAHVSKAIIIGFNVRPSANIRKLAEQKEVEIRTYSVIYHAIEEIKDAIRGMLKPIIKEEYLGSAKVLKIFKIKGVGTVAGCQVEQGKITADANVRVIRNGTVVYDGELASLKRYQEDVNEVKAPQECGLSIKNFNDIKKDDTIEAYRKIEVEQKF